MAEHHEQVAVFTWADYNGKKHPELQLIFAVPNAGKRNPATAQWYKAEGLRAGVPDIHLPVARGGYHGLWIEMKFGKNTLTKEQRAFMEDLREQGHLAMVCYSASEAINCIEKYLNMPRYVLIEPYNQNLEQPI